VSHERGLDLTSPILQGGPQASSNLTRAGRSRISSGDSGCEGVAAETLAEGVVLARRSPDRHYREGVKKGEGRTSGLDLVEMEVGSEDLHGKTAPGECEP
jgi:hypothetical protein